MSAIQCLTLGALCFIISLAIDLPLGKVVFSGLAVGILLRGRVQVERELKEQDKDE